MSLSNPNLPQSVLAMVTLMAGVILPAMGLTGLGSGVRFEVRTRYF